MKTRFAFLLVALALTFAAIPDAFGAKAPARKAVLACDWYWIQCFNGYQDQCCGNFNTCQSYCQQVCDGPCIYVGTAQPASSGVGTD